VGRGVKIIQSYEIGDRVLVKIPVGPIKFSEVVGVIEDITLHFDEVSDTSNTVYVIKVSGNFYNVAYVQILGVENVESHEHKFLTMCIECGQGIND
jgi:hypothetical protein